jgi:hypothetical protein
MSFDSPSDKQPPQDKWDKLNWRDAEQATSALSVIFWGALLHIFDFHFSQTSNGWGFRFDILNDAVAAAMIAWGVVQLRPLVQDERYVRIMGFVQVISLLAVLDAVRLHFIVPWPLPLSLMFDLFHVVALVAIYYFCVAMRILCDTWWLPDGAESWSLSSKLFLFLNLLPTVTIQAIGLLAIVAGHGGFHVNSPLAIPLILLLLVPVIHILISIRRTGRLLRFGPPPGGIAA